MLLTLVFLKFIVLSFIFYTNATFTPHFRAFLNKNFQNASRFERNDLGNSASFGGKLNDNDILINNVSDKKQNFYYNFFKPIVFVHGTTGSASYFNLHREYFEKRDYKKTELFATTYSDAGQTSVISKTMDCVDVKLV